MMSDSVTVNRFLNALLAFEGDAGLVAGWRRWPELDWRKPSLSP